MHADISKVLISEEELDRIVTELAARIDRDHRDTGRELVLLCILKGAVVFMGDLMKKLTIPVDIDFMKVSSYGSGTATSGKINVILDVKQENLIGHDVLVVEDVIDSGRTLSYLTQYLKERGAVNVKTCTLLDKPSRREVEFVPDYVGAEVPDEFVVGYGLDYDEKYRTLPYVGILRPEVYGEA